MFVGEPPLKPNVHIDASIDNEAEAVRITRAYKTSLYNYRNDIRNVLREKREPATNVQAKLNNIRKHQLSKELGISLDAAGRKEVAERRMLRRGRG